MTLNGPSYGGSSCDLLLSRRINTFLQSSKVIGTNDEDVPCCDFSTGKRFATFSGRVGGMYWAGLSAGVGEAMKSPLYKKLLRFPLVLF